MEDRTKEYNNRAEEIRDGWRGTYLGMACIVVLLLAFRELSFGNQFVGNGGLIKSSLKVGCALAFATVLFFVKDAQGYNTLEKIRFALFAWLFFSIFALWIVPLTNRVLLGEKRAEMVWAYVHYVEGDNHLRIGKRQANEAFDFYKLHLEVLASEVAEPNPKTIADISYLKVYGPVASLFQSGQRIQVKLYHGRWGQAFIEQP